MHWFRAIYDTDTKVIINKQKFNGSKKNKFGKHYSISAVVYKLFPQILDLVAQFTF